MRRDCANPPVKPSELPQHLLQMDARGASRRSAARCSCSLIGLSMVVAVTACQAPAHLPSNADVAVAQAPVNSSIDSRDNVAPSAPSASGSGEVPLGRWRLVSPHELEHSILWLSQILIRHANSDSEQTALIMDAWTIAPPPPMRTREEARALAEHLAERARQHPESFAALAKEFSEDAATRDRGGSLGGVVACQLSPWTQLLDALSTVGEGQISRVVETPFGFHILQRRSPPPDEIVSGERIVIGYDRATQIKFQSCKELPNRSRSEALALASRLYERVTRNPALLPELAAHYSDACDASQKGDFGAWSTRARTAFPEPIEQLAQLAVGEVAPPLDTPIGMQIIRRTQNRERAQLAMDPIRLPFDPRLPPSNPGSKAAARRRAKALIIALQKDPEQFSAQKQRLWWGDVEYWTEGAGEPLTTQMLRQVPVGGITSEPIPSSYSYVVARRIDPSSVPSESIQLELPAPAGPDFQWLLAEMDRTYFDEQLHAVAEQLITSQSLVDPIAGELRALQSGWAPSGGSPSKSRQAAFDALQTRIRALLGDAMFEKYRRRLDAHFENLLLTPSRARSTG